MFQVFARSLRLSQLEDSVSTTAPKDYFDARLTLGLISVQSVTSLKICIKDHQGPLSTPHVRLVYLTPLLSSIR